MKINSREVSAMLTKLAWFYRSEASRAEAIGMDELSGELQNKADEAQDTANSFYEAKTIIDTEQK